MRVFEFLLAFVGQVIAWFSLWQFADHAPWTVADMLILLSIPLLMYLVSHLIVPELDDGLVHDMRESYDPGRRPHLLVATEVSFISLPIG